MDSRGLVQQTLTFSSPKRVPRDLWTLPWAAEHHPDALATIRARFPNDIVTAPSFLPVEPLTSGDQYSIGTYVDEWGCAFENVQRGVIGEVKHPLVGTWEEIDRVKTPDTLLAIDPEQINAFCRQETHFVMGGCCPRPFERMQFLRGSENLYIDLADPPQQFYTLLGRVHQFYLEQMDRWAQTGVDGLMFMDDWGAQRSLLISPKLWRKVFKPLYREYIDLAHRYGKFAFMHSDGYTLDILPDLIELGLDAINTQIFCMDIEELGRRFKGKITFWGELDRQHLLPFGEISDIDQAVRRIRDALYASGGVIAQCEFGAGARPENVYRMFATWEEARIPSEH